MKNQKWDACIDCGIEKTKQQCKSPRCKSCAQKESQKRPEVKECMSVALKNALNNHESRAKREAFWSDPENKSKHALATKNAMNNADTRAKLSTASSRSASRPDAVARMKHGLNRPEVRIKLSLTRGGDGDLERINRKRRHEDEYRSSITAQWSTKVKERDGHLCQNCGSTKHLHAHHIKPRAMFPELSLVLENGITLCKECHIKEHRRLRSLSTQQHNSF